MDLSTISTYIIWLYSKNTAINFGIELELQYNKNINVPNPLLTEEELFYAIKSRYKIGAEQLYDQYACKLYKIICSQVKQKQIADDLLEQTFLNIWTNIDQCRCSNCRLSIWVAGVARETVKNNLTANKNLISLKPVTKMHVIPAMQKRLA